jgi:multiple sugar transport system substrate-binding protein
MAALLCAGLLVIGLAGCGKGKASADKQIVIRFNTLDSGIYAEPMQLIADRYMAENPGVKIEMEIIPDNYDTKLLAQLSSNSAADLINLGATAKDFGEQGIVVDLMPYIKASGWDLDQYIPSTLLPGKVGGKLYTLPKDYSSFAILYNKKLFDAAGIPYPKDGWTWDECIATARALTNVGEGRWGIEFQGLWVDPFEAILYAYGGRTVSPDGKQYTGYLNSDASVRAITDYVRWHTVDKVAPTPSQRNSMSTVDLFATGKVAMFMYGPWALEDYAANPEIDFGTVRLPAGPKGQKNSLAWLGYGINAKSKVKDEAFKFLTYFCGPVGSEILTVTSLPTVKSVNEKYRARAPEYLLPWINDIDNIIDNGWTLDPHWNQTGSEALSSSLDKLMQDPSLDVRTVLTAAAAAADKTLADLAE